MEEKKSTRKEGGMPEPVKTEYSHESTLLQTVNQLITKFGNDPNYKVKSKNFPLYGYSVEELKKVRDGIYPTSWEKAVMSRSPAFELSDDEDDLSKQDWETEGSGITDDEAEKLINQLYLSLGSMKAGNSSIKLKN